MRSIYTILCLFLLGSTVANAQVGVIPKGYIDSLIELTNSDSLFYFQKIKHAEKALEYATAIDYSVGQFKANMASGRCYLNLNRYDFTLKHFQDARLIAGELDSLEFQAYAEYFLGNVYNKLENSTKASNHFKKALDLYQKQDNKRWIGIIKNGLGVVHLKNNRQEEGLECLKQALAIFENNGLEAESAIPINNIGEYYYNEDKFEIALKYYERALQLSKTHNDPKGEALANANIGRSLAKLNRFQDGLQAIQQGLELAQLHQFNEEEYALYKDLSDTYKEMGDVEQSLKYYETYAQLKDSVINKSVKNRIAGLQISFEIENKERALEEKQSELLALIQKQKITKLMNVIMVGGLGLASIIFYLFISRNKARRKLIEKELENTTLERENLERKLEFKHKDLTNFALDIDRKNNFALTIHKRLKDLVHTKPQFFKSEAQKLLHLTTNHLKINEDFSEFQMNVETVNQDFFNKLESSFPELTANEKQLCGLIRLNLSTKDIASIKNISPKSVEMGRYRLRKKLKMEPQEEISSFLQKL